MSSLWVQLLVLALLITLNGFFALSELSVLKAKKGRLQRSAVRGDRGAKAALALLKEPGRFLSAVQVGMTLTGVLAGAFGGATFADPVALRLEAAGLSKLYAHLSAFALVVGGITYLTLVLGELVPKRLALKHPNTLASYVAPPMRFLLWVAAPAVWVLSASTEAVMRLVSRGGKAEPAVTEEEIEMALDQGVQEGILEQSERAMVKEVLRLGDRPVSLLMTHRSEIVFVPAGADPDRVVETIVRTRHPEFPVCGERPDDVLGVLNAKDYLTALIAGRRPAPRDQMREALFVPSSRSALEVLDLIKRRSAHMALCVDEHGGVEGLVTLRDFLGVIVGEGEFDQRENERPALKREDGSWLLSGVLGTDELREVLGLGELPGESQGLYRTLGGFLLSRFGRIPAEGDAVDWNGWRFEVADMDGRRIDKVLASRTRPEE